MPTGEKLPIVVRRPGAGGDFRGGRRLSDAVRVGALSLSLFAAAGGAARAAEAPVRRPVATSTKSGPMRFGVDVDSVKDLKAKGVDVSYGNFWVGPWTQKQGWANTDRELKIAKSQGVTPVINWWYWGDDISPQFVEQGGRDKYQGVHKDRATWIRMSAGLEGLIWRSLKDDPTFDTANYHGVAERHWGLVRADGSFKKAYGTFVSGVAQERSSGAGNAN